MYSSNEIINKNKEKSMAGKTFLTALVISFAIFLPFIIKDHGLYLMHGDFNVQQIPFYQLVHKAIRNGDIFWSWTTDLGANFIGSYSFYLFFSPFFWLTLAFPTFFTPYLMAPLLALKTACAAYTSYWYIERFVRDKKYAMLGGLLYAFSGWMFFNTFFNHFHEVAVFFPLLLLSVEKLVTENKKVFFALMVAVNATVNYWFFVGEVVFVVIYIIVRSYSRGWGITWKKFARIAIESVMGLLLAAGALVPSLLAIMGNPRADTDRILYGWGFWTYWHNSDKYGDYPQRILAILQSLIFPPEIVARPNFFPLHGAQWASLSAWIPMFGLVGVIAYFIQTRDKPNWIRKILPLCLFFALIPGFNSMFSAFNNAYYARWFYMPILLMSLATVIALEKGRENPKSFLTGVKWVTIVAVLFAVACGLTPDKKDGKWVIGLAKDPALLWIWVFIVMLSMAIIFVAFKYFHNKRSFYSIISGGLVFIIITFGTTYFMSGQFIYPHYEDIAYNALDKQGKFELPNERLARSDVYDDMDNLLMYWDMPNIQAFHSVVPPSIMEFYDFIGVKRAEASRPETDDFALRSLLSVRWLFVNATKEEQEPMPGYNFYEKQNAYNIYENRAYIPLGFAYDYYIPQEEIERVKKSDRTQIMLKAMVLEDDIKPPTTLELLPGKAVKDINMANYIMDSEARTAEAVLTFNSDKRGFSATSNYETAKMVFFSVPYDMGWSAYVNGKPAPIYKANVGFMAVEVPAGEAEIRFNYMTPGLLEGMAVTGVMALIILIYGIVVYKKNMKNRKELSLEKAYLEGKTTTLSWSDYLSLFGKEERQEMLIDDIREGINNAIIEKIENSELKEPETETNDKNCVRKN